MEPVFLDLETVLAYHAEQIELYGGALGVLDQGLLESALASPQNLYLYDEAADIFDCATAYAYHLAKNHPFRDGNKRTALEAALGFLKVNGLDPQLPSGDLLYEGMIRLIEETLPKELFANLLTNACTERWFTVEYLREPVMEKAAALLTPWSEPRKRGEPPALELAGVTGFTDPRKLAEAHAVDLMTSFTRAFLIEKCERYGINPSRFDGLPQLAEEILYPIVTERLRRNFSME